MASGLPRLDGLRGCSEAEMLARIQAAADALAHTPTPELLVDSLPRSLDGFGGEVVLALADLWLRLARHRPPLPSGRDGLQPALKIAWLRVELACEPPAQWLEQLDDRDLLQGFVQPPPCTPALLERLVVARDPRLRIASIEQIERAIAELVLEPEQGCALLLRLCGDTQVRIARAAFESLGHPAFSALPDRLAADRRG